MKTAKNLKPPFSARGFGVYYGKRCITHCGGCGSSVKQQEEHARFIAEALNDKWLQESEPNGAKLIAAERQRQIEKEGWSAEHDEQHRLGEMVSAAACYLAVAQAQVVSQASKRAIEPDLRVLSLWPWDDKWWKPSTSIRNLVKAGALIAAEIDRVQRLNKHRKPYAKVAPEGL